ncbi:hypothetical protein D3C71_2208280 [compost metagenome]
MGSALMALSEVAAVLPDASGQAGAGLYDQRALEALQRAMQLNPQAGVKKQIEILQRRVKNQAENPG